jgi:hypothetical protein
MVYTQAAAERAVKVHEILMQALNGRQPWIHVVEVLGVSARTVRRLRWRYERYGFTGLYDHRERTPSPRRCRGPKCSGCSPSTATATGPATGTPASTCATALRSPGASTACSCPTPS